MRILILGSLLLVAGYSFVYGQKYVAAYQNKGGLSWGYITSEDQILISPKLVNAFGVSEEGIAVVNTKKFMTLDGKMMKTKIAGDYKLIGEGSGVNVVGFSCGLIPVKIGRHWGFMGVNGDLLIQSRYDFVTPFEDGHALVRRDKAFFILDVSGNEVPVKADPDAMDRFSEGLAPYRDNYKRYGFINLKGEIQIQAQFKKVGYFNGGLAWARDMDNRLGYVDTKGNWVIKPLYEVAKDFDPISGIALVIHKGRKEYINEKGEVLDVFPYGHKYSYINGFAIARVDDQLGFINPEGEWISDPVYKTVRNFKNGFAVVEYKNGWGVINSEGEWVIEPKYGAIKNMDLVRGEVFETTAKEMINVTESND